MYIFIHENGYEDKLTFKSFLLFILGADIDWSIKSVRISKKLKKQGFKYHRLINANLKTYLKIIEYFRDDTGAVPNYKEYLDMLEVKRFINTGDVIICFSSLYGKMVILFKSEEDLVQFNLVMI